MRLAAIEKGGYYPYPEQLAAITASYIQPAVIRGRLLDPCAGEGIIGEILGQLLNCETWGTELFPQRAEIAKTRFDMLHASAFQNVGLTERSISLLWLNPPYDWDRLGDEKRIEVEMLRQGTPKLEIGGVLAFIIPQKVLKYAATVLAGHYADVRAYRFPDPEYEIFKQVVVFGQRKGYSTPLKERVEIIAGWATNELPEMTMCEKPLYLIPPAPAGAKFTDFGIEKSALVELTRTKGVSTTEAWKSTMIPDEETAMLSPAMPLKKGHLAMLMSSGMIGTMRLTGEDGNVSLIRGRVAKKILFSAKADPKDPEVVVETFRDKFVTTITQLGQDGISKIEDTEALIEFMKEYGEQIATGTLQSYKPLYDLHATEKEMAILDRLGLRRKPIPGQKPGLLPVQKHTSISSARAITAYSSANVQGEMGVGKTTIGAATAELLGKYPVIVLCPPHLVEKWIREIGEIIPGAYGRELRKIGMENGRQVNDVRKFVDDYEKGHIPRKSFAVIASTSAKLASGWTPAVKAKAIRNSETGQRLLGFTCPSCGGEIMLNKEQYVTEVSYFQKNRQFCTNTIKGWKDDAEKGAVQVWGNRTCNAPLFAYTTGRRYSIAEFINKQHVNFFKLLIADEVHEYKAATTDRSVAFHQLAEACRKTLTLTGTFFGGKSTTIFWLLYRLSRIVREKFKFTDEMRWVERFGILESSARRKIGDNEDEDDGIQSGGKRYRGRGEGHESPGVSPAIIQHLLHNTTFVNLKDLNVDLPSYQEDVVSLDMTESQGVDYRKMEGSLRELARQQPRFLGVWLQWALARPNSAFRDEVVNLHIFNIPANMLDELAKGMFKLADEQLKTGDTTLTKFAIAIAKAAQLKQEATGRRGKEEAVDCPIMDLPSMTGILPKEKWLIDYCKTEIAQKRRVIVYMRQTGTRDIQEHVESLLRANGINAITLSGSVGARKREEWIEKRSDYDVLICNPKLVQTGLDLVSFATIVFYEVEYSLYTLWQALRRVWRLGQTKPVKAVFVVYKGTLEEKALALMGKKMRAAQLLYGDEVAGAITDDNENDDILTELAKAVLKNTDLGDLKTLFSNEGRVSHSPVGEMTQTSAVILPLPSPERAMITNIMSWAEFQLANNVQKLKPTKKRIVPPSSAQQNSMF